MPTTVTLTPELESALSAKVGKGRYASLEEAVHMLLARALFDIHDEDEAEDDEDEELDFAKMDLSELKPLVAEAERQVREGKFYTLEESERRVDEFMKELVAR